MRGVTTAVLVCGGFLAGCFVSQLELAQSLRVVPALDPSAGSCPPCQCVSEPASSLHGNPAAHHPDNITEAPAVPEDSPDNPEAERTPSEEVQWAPDAESTEPQDVEQATRAPAEDQEPGTPIPVPDQDPDPAASPELEEGAPDADSASERVAAANTVPFDDWRCECAVPIEDASAWPESAFWTKQRVTPDMDLKQALASQAMTFGSWEDTVMVMMTNKGEVDLLENLLCSLRMVGINKYLTFATDDSAEAALRARNINVFPMKRLKLFDWTFGESEHIGFASKGFHRFVRAKIQVHDIVLNAGFSLLFSDVDIAWQENILPEMLSGTKDAYWMKDVDEFNKVVSKRKKIDANSGFFLLRRGPAQQAFHKRMYRVEKERGVTDDQKLVNHALDRNLRNYFNRTRISNGCMLNNLQKTGMLPEGGQYNKNIPIDERVGRRFKDIKIAHMNCSINKTVKLTMYCQHQYWYCRNMPFLDARTSTKVSRACSHLALKENTLTRRRYYSKY
mmetsp:Transcript_29055/g.55791  ORF Transcript_29055/g.55791 Transcript_29055/m.55791 type:complete len:506 (+) Transcript_29055:66-1583(+)